MDAIGSLDDVNSAVLIERVARKYREGCEDVDAMVSRLEEVQLKVQDEMKKAEMAPMDANIGLLHFCEQFFADIASALVDATNANYQSKLGVVSPSSPHDVEQVWVYYGNVGGGHVGLLGVAFAECCADFLLLRLSNGHAHLFFGVAQARFTI